MDRVFQDILRRPYQNVLQGIMRDVALRNVRPRMNQVLQEIRTRPNLLTQLRRVAPPRQTEREVDFNAQDVVPTLSFISVSVRIQLSTDTRTYTFNFEYQGNNLQDEIDRRIQQYFNIEFYTLLDSRVIIRNNDSVRQYDIGNMRMREQQPLDLSINLFNNVIKIKPSTENCVKTHLRNTFPLISKQKKDPIGKLGNIDGVTINELLEFCTHFKIRMIAYDIHKNVIAQHHPINPSSKFRSLIFLSYNNHIYPIKNKILEERPKKVIKETLCTQQEIKDKFKELLNNNILPAEIKLYNDEPSSFIHENTLYFVNDDYKECLNVLKLYGLEDQITPFIRFTNILDIIESLYTQTKSSQYLSFFPIEFQKSAFIYNKKMDETREIETHDKNKCYASALKNLPHLLTTDYRTNPIESINIEKDEIIENALYVASPKFPNILMPKQDIYAGEHIKFCHGKFEFTVTERIKCKKHANIYKFIIQDLYERVPEDVFKKITTRTIGAYQKAPTISISSDVTLVSPDERDPKHELIPTINDYHFQRSNEQTVKNLYNRRPIAIQIKDYVARLIYNRMADLNLTAEDIIQINTDSITFYKSSITSNLNPKDLDGWKLSNYKESTANIFDRTHPIITMKQKQPNNNTIILGYAGNGKSYHIKHNLYQKDAIVLSSKHSALTQHRQDNLNSQVLQYYNFKNLIPTEQIWIVEECGILDKSMWDLLFKGFLLKKKLIVLGDFNQLLPVNEASPYNSPDFLNWLFRNQEVMNTNWRNHFTTQYYDALINSKNPEFLKQELLKHSTKKPWEAEVIIAYRNSTVDAYNNLMLKRLNKTIEDPDVPMICIDNELREKEIFNQYQFKSQDIDPEDLKHFKPAYARTIYNLQGDQVKSYYIAEEDIDYLTKCREAYTIISRLKTK